MAPSTALLEISPYQADGGELIGKHPRDVRSDFLSLKFRAQNPLNAIREKCIDCCCGNAAEVRKCVAVDCALWPYRMGTNPFRKKRTLSAKQKREMAQRLSTLNEPQPDSNDRAHGGRKKRRPVVQTERRDKGDETRSITLAGRFAWCLEKLVIAGERGITALDEIGPLLSHYVFVLRRRYGLTIKTREEKHGGQFSGWHGRYVLHTKACVITADNEV